MIIKLNESEQAELRKHATGAFGRHNVYSFCAEIAEGRMDEATGEIDIDRDDLELIAEFRAKGHKRKLDKIFKRPIDEMLEKFFGR